MIKIMIVLVILACIGPFFLKGPDGKPLMTLDDWKPEFPEVLIDLLPKSAKGSLEDEAAVNEPTKVYRWQDEDGIWHFSTDADDADRGEVMELDGNINTIPAFVAPVKQESAPSTTASVSAMPSLTTIPIGQAQDLIKQAKNLQMTVDSRKAELDKVLGEDN